MGITPVAFVAGAPILAADVLTELNRIRGWINTGIVAGDLVAGSVVRTAIYRPETLGYPTQRTVAPLQELYEDGAGAIERTVASYGAGGGALNERATRERSSIFVQHLLVDEAWVVPHMGRRVFLGSAATVEVCANWRARTQLDWNAGPEAPDVAGQFRLVYRAIGGAKTAVAGTARRLNVDTKASGAADRLGVCAYSTGMVISLSAGTYDIWLEYLRNGAAAAVEQVIIGTRSIVVEIHK